MFDNLYDAHMALKEKKVSSKELTEDCLKKLGENENNSFITVLKEKALKDAENCDSQIKKKGLHSFLQGIPYSLKDLFITKNIRTTAGSKILYNYIPPYQGYVASQLEKAGGILIGKNGCDEFGMGSSNQNTPYGCVTHPLNPDYVPGGSSGGSAVSVLEKSSFYSIGTDTGGSVRLPANFCGIVGYKPSYGRVSRYGQIAYGSSLDQASPFAKTPLDIAMIMEELTENDRRDSTQAPAGKMKVVEKLLKERVDLKSLKIGYDPSFIESCREDVKSELESALDFLKNEGVQLVEVSLPHLKYSVAVYYLVATSEASSNLARFDGIHYGYSDKSQVELEQVYIESRSQGFCDEVKRRILIGTFALSSGYSDEYFNHACKVRRLILQDFKNAFEKCNFIFSPVSATTAFKTDENRDPLQMYMSDLYTIPANLAGLPSMALPWGHSKVNQMPTGFQLIGNSFDDEHLIHAAHAIFKSGRS